MPDKVQLTW